MRRAALVLGPISLLAGAMFACEDDGGGAGGPSFGLDGSVPAFDGGQQPFDAGPTPEASADAPPGPPSVTVTITGRSGPTANVRVVFHDATGAVLETKLTGADGKAKSTGALPAMASALVATSGADRHIVTWTGLENGDELALRDNSSNARLGQFNITTAGLFTDAGASSYDLLAGDCSGFMEGTVGSVDLYSYCVNAQSSVLVRARDVDNLTVGHSFKKGNPVPTDGGVVEVATGEWKLPTNVTINATNLPPNQGTVNASLLEIADGSGYSTGFDRSLDGSSATFTTATGFADALQGSIQMFPQSLGSRQVITKRVAPAATITLDASQALPAITGANLSGTDARRPVLSWTSSSTAAADGGLVHVRFNGTEDANYEWTFVVPPGSTSVTAPAMPPEADSFLPAPGDAGPVGFQIPDVMFVEADVLPSYAAFRRQQGTLIGLQSFIGTATLPALPVNGTYRTTGWMLSL